MKTVSLVAVAACLSLPYLAFAQHEHHMGGMQGSMRPSVNVPAKPSTERLAAKQTGKQTLCPVDGKPVDPSITADWKGQKIAFCSQADASRFQRNPGAYLPNVYNQLYPQGTQVTCPIMGNEVNPKIFVEHDGRKVFFCCPGCNSKYEANPAKYAAKLQAGSTAQVHCPIDGKPVDPRYSVEGSAGNTYFCSEKCVEKYNQNEKAYAEAVLPEAGRIAAAASPADDLVMCPVDGNVKPHREMKTLAHGGRLYFFDKPECVEAFKAAPEKYVQKLQSAMKERLAGGRNALNADSDGTDSRAEQGSACHKGQEMASGHQMSGSGQGGCCH